MVLKKRNVFNNTNWSTAYHNLCGAAEFFADDDHLGERRIKRKLDHATAHRCEFSSVVQGSEGPQLVHRVENVVLSTSATNGYIRKIQGAFCFGTCGGGSIKSNCNRSLTPSDLSSNTTLARLVRWISGIVLGNSSCLKAWSV